MVVKDRSLQSCSRFGFGRNGSLGTQKFWQEYITGAVAVLPKKINKQTNKQCISASAQEGYLACELAGKATRKVTKAVRKKCPSAVHNIAVMDNTTLPTILR